MADIRIIPNRTSGDPYMVFSPSGTASSGINLYVLTSATGLSDTGVATLSFEGSQGQLFSVTDQLQSGVIFSVNDIGGLPLIEADASGYVYLARYGESVGVGQYINSGVRLLVSPGLTSRVGLAITGVAGQTADLFQVRNASGNALFGISPSGKIGIGTGTPTTNIHLTDSYPQILLDRSTTGGNFYTEIQFAIQNNIKAYIWHEYDTNNGIDDIAIGDGLGDTAFRVARSGSVSVSAGPPGYAYPIAKYRLAVNGFGTTTGTYSATFNDNNGTSLLAIRDDGNVGIGTLTPNSKLEINTVSSVNKGLLIKGAAAQAANLIEIQNSTGTNLVTISNNGAISGGAAIFAGQVRGTSFTTDGSSSITINTALSRNRWMASDALGIDIQANVDVPTSLLRVTYAGVEFPLSINRAGATIAGYTLTGSQALSVLDISQTWNTTGIPSAIKLNITDTASNTDSLLMDLQVGGTGVFSVKKNGDLTLSPMLGSGGTRTLLCETGRIRFRNSGSGRQWIVIDGTTTNFGHENLFSLRVNVDNPMAALRSDAALAWSANTSTPPINTADTTHDVRLYRDASNILAQQNGMNPQTFRLYNNYINATGFENLQVQWSGNEARIGTSVGSTSGTTRNLVLGTWNSSNIWRSGLAITPNNEIIIGSGTGARLYFANAAGMPWITNYSNAGITIYKSAGSLGSLYASEFILDGAAGYLYFTNRGLMSSSANGVLHVQNFDRNESVDQALCFGPGTSPSSGIRLRRTVNTTTLAVRNGDDTADASITAATGIFFSGVRYPDGVVQTIAYTGQSTTGTFVVTGTYTAGSGLTLNGYEFSTFGTGNFTGGVRYPDGIIQTVAYTGQGSGGSSYTAGSGLILDGTTFNLSGTGQLSALLFDNDHVRIGNVSASTGYQSNSSSVIIGKAAGSGHVKTGPNDFAIVYIGEHAGSQITGINTNAIFIGSQAGRGLYNSTIKSNIIAIGTAAGKLASNNSNIAMIGQLAGSESSGLTSSNAIGQLSAYRGQLSFYSDWIGYQAGYSINNCGWTVGVGPYAGYKNTGVWENTYIGAAAGAYQQNTTGSVAVGRWSGRVRYGNNSISIGSYAHGTAQEMLFGGINQFLISQESIAIGFYTSYESPETSYNTSIGRYANAYSSGIHNVFLGSYAGYGTTGNNNLEIVSSGLSTSIIGNTSNKLNINYSIVGDTSSKKFAIGDVGLGNLNPNATLEVLTKVSTDKAFIVKGATSQSANLTEWQNSLGTTLLRVDNLGNISGSVNLNINNVTMNTGTANVIYLNNNTPSNTTDALYNSNGTLYFNGSPVASGSGPSGGVTVETSIIHALIFG